MQYISANTFILIQKIELINLHRHQILYKTRQLTSRYCLIEKLTFSSTNGDSKCVVMVCSCDHGLEQKHRLA